MSTFKLNSFPTPTVTSSGSSNAQGSGITGILDEAAHFTEKTVGLPLDGIAITLAAYLVAPEDSKLWVAGTVAVVHGLLHYSAVNAHNGGL